METNENNQNNTPAPVAQADNSTLMCILAYLGLLVLIPLLTSKENPLVKFHIKQGLVLLVLEAGIMVIGMLIGGMYIGGLYMLINLANIAVFILSIIGIINVTQKKQVELPLVGQFGKMFNI